MSIKCKVCSNETVRSQVDRMIEEGVSDEAISRGLATVGVEIAKSGIFRHRQNHAPKPIPKDDGIPSDLTVPRPEPIAPSPAMGDEPAKLLEEIRDKVNRSDIDITQDRMVREMLLSRIMESQLAITATALDRFQHGEGRYPLDMVRGLSVVGTLFEKTKLHTTASSETEAAIFEREIQRLEAVARNEAKESVLSGHKVSKKPPENHLMPWDAGYPPGYKYFHFGQKHMKGEEFNDRIELAWHQGIAQGKAELAATNAGKAA